jgi:CheY-like chemotaxis protein
MPKLDGYALTRRIRQIESEQNRMRTPIFAWTSTPTPDELARISESGMDGILGKPVDVEALEQLLSERPSSKPPAGPSARKFKTSHQHRYWTKAFWHVIRVATAQSNWKYWPSSMPAAGAIFNPSNVPCRLQTRLMVAQYCHRLKGASRMIGASVSRQPVDRWKSMGVRGNWDDINAYQDDLFDELRKLRVAMESR